MSFVNVGRHTFVERPQYEGWAHCILSGFLAWIGKGLVQYVRVQTSSLYLDTIPYYSIEWWPFVTYIFKMIEAETKYTFKESVLCSIELDLLRLNLIPISHNSQYNYDYLVSIMLFQLNLIQCALQHIIYIIFSYYRLLYRDLFIDGVTQIST